MVVSKRANDNHFYTDISWTGDLVYVSFAGSWGEGVLSTLQPQHHFSGGGACYHGMLSFPLEKWPFSLKLC